MGNIVERLRALFQRFLEWWNRFTTRQKTLIVSLCAGVIVVIAIVVAYSCFSFESIIIFFFLKNSSIVLEVFRSYNKE